MPDAIPAAALASYLNGAMHVDALAAILECGAWDAPDPLGSTALRLIYEFGNGDWDERELRDRLRQLIARPPGIILGLVGFRGLTWTNHARGIAIRRDPAGNPGPSPGPIRWSRSEQYSGVGIGGTAPVEGR